MLRLKGGDDSCLEGFFQNVTSMAKDFNAFKEYFEPGEFDFVGKSET